ncbi:MAG: hypothetical protein U0234_16805 [Sandaracinus sp.]
MSSLTRARTSLVVPAIFFAAGCGLAVRPSPDAAAAGDAAVARADTSVLGDAGMLAADASSCAEPLVWIDAAPITREVLEDRPPVLVAGPAGLDLLYAYWDADACFSRPDAICLSADHFAADGGEGPRREPSWAAALGEPRGLFGGRDPSGVPYFAIASADRVAWSHAPTGDGWEAPEGSVALTGVLGDVALGASEVYVYTATSAPRAGGRDDTLVSGVLTAYALDGSGAHAIDRDLAFGSTFWSPRLLGTAAGPWLALITDFDFPPTVQIAGPDAIRSFEGSSCGVESYDLAAFTETDVVVVEDCGARVRLRARPGWAAGPIPGVELEDRDASAGVRSRVAYAAGHVVSARRTIEGVRVAVHDAQLRLLADVVVPGSEGTFPGSLSVTASDDGTMAVLYVAPYAAGAANGEARLRRFRLCDAR